MSEDEKSGSAGEAEPEHIVIPLELAIETKIKHKRIADNIISICKELRQHIILSTRGSDPFRAVDRPRTTPVGRESKNQKSEKKSNSKDKDKKGFITINAQLQRAITKFISMLYTEAYLGIHYLAYRLDELNIVRVSLSDLLTYIGGDQQLAKEKIKIWTKKALALYDREGVIDDTCVAMLRNENIDDLTSYASASRVRSRLDLVYTALNQACASRPPPHRISLSRSPTGVYTAIDHLIIVQQPDFDYPFGRSFLEVVSDIVNRGGGFNQLRDIGSHKVFTDIYTELLDDIKQDFKEAILPVVQADKLTDRIGLHADLFEDMAYVVSNFIFAFAIQAFNYAAAQTDKVASTTIQFRAFKTILNMLPSSTYTPFTPEQMGYFELLMRKLTEKPGDD